MNLVAQRDTKINLAVVNDPNQVAILAARDSVTMRTTTVLRLLFLASTLVGVSIPSPLSFDSFLRSYGFVFGTGGPVF